MRDNSKKINLGEIEKGYIINRDGTIFSKKRNKYMKLSDNHGYYILRLSLNGVPSQYSVHRLVATKYIPNPNNKPQVNHKDGNKKNNHVSNLEWVTQSENIKHSIYELGKTGHGAVKPKKVSRDGVVYASIKDAAEQTGIFPQLITDSIAGRSVPTFVGNWKIERNLRKL